MKKLRLRKEIREFLDKLFGFAVMCFGAILIVAMIRGGF